MHARKSFRVVFGLMLGLAVALNVDAARLKTLKFCSEGSPEGFDPAQYVSGTTFDASAETLYNRLVQFEPGSTRIIAGLADKWTVAPDGSSVTFSLRRNVAFHTTEFFSPGRAFNATDVVFSFERMLDSNHPYHRVAPKGFPYAESMALTDTIKEVKRIDDYTVRFVLKAPEAAFLANLAMPFASILSAEYAQTLMRQGKPENLNLQPIGTGPFVFKSYQKDELIRYEAFPQYFAGKQPIERLVFAITPDPSVRYQKLKTGECHVMVYPRPADVAAMKQDPGLTVLGQNGLNVAYLAYNIEKKPFGDRQVREALTLAINKNAIIQAVYAGAGVPAKNPLPPTIWSYNDQVQDTPYDPARAKRLLGQAGYPDGFETTLWAMPVQRGYNPNARQMAELIQADWARIGVKARIVTYEWGEYLKRSKAGEHDTLLLGWTGDNGDPDNFLFTLLSCDAVKSGENRSRWCNRDFHDLVAEAKKTSDQSVRASLYRKAQEIFRQDVPWATIAHSYVYEPIRKEVLNYKMSPFGLHSFVGVDLQ